MILARFQDLGKDMKNKFLLHFVQGNIPLKMYHNPPVAPDKMAVCL